MMQTFDGSREFSHTQTAGFARMRKGQESWIELNFGNGAVVIEKPGKKTQASRFRNTSGVETGMRYNYATRTISGGERSVADYHNRYVRPQLGKGPALGANASWTANMTLAQLGFAALGRQSLTIELSREYFSFEGKDYGLLRYKVPSFTYTKGGRSVVHWGEGAALTDPGFGQMYWNASLQRAVASKAGETGRPYRFAKTMAALDAKGQPLIDPRRMPQVAENNSTTLSAGLDAFYQLSREVSMSARAGVSRRWFDNFYEDVTFVERKDWNWTLSASVAGRPAKGVVVGLSGGYEKQASTFFLSAYDAFEGAVQVGVTFQF